jgi:hypothetical protein
MQVKHSVYNDLDQPINIRYINSTLPLYWTKASSLWSSKPSLVHGRRSFSMTRIDLSWNHLAPFNKALLLGQHNKNIKN